MSIMQKSGLHIYYVKKSGQDVKIACLDCKKYYSNYPSKAPVRQLSQCRTSDYGDKSLFGQ
jgi:hypothetical protein